MVVSKVKRTRILFVLAVIIGIHCQGCVAVQEQANLFDPAGIPPGHAAIIIAVPHEYPDENRESFFMHLGSESYVTLSQKALNLFYLPEGTWQFYFPNIPQDENNIQLLHTLEAGKLQRFILVRRTPLADTTLVKEGKNPVEYLLLPSRQIVFQELRQKDNLEFITLRVSE